MPASLARGVTRREAWAWAMYDFANSGYTTVVITAVFSAYFVAVVADGASWATLAWTSALAVSYALVILGAPLLGAYADAFACKKRLLLYSTLGCVAGTAALALAGPGALGLALLFIVLSNCCFGCGENLIAAFLPEIAREDAIGRVSGWGWGLGYIGGLVSLGSCLGYVAWAQAQGQTAAQFVPVCMLITAALFAVASLPTFLFLRERSQPQLQPGARHDAGVAWRRFARTLGEAGRYRDLLRFLACTVCYQAGIAAVITLAAIYANQAMGFSTQDTLLLILLVNVTASIGALLFGHLQDRLGHRPTLALTLLGWLLMIGLALAAEGPPLFWLAANIAGLCMGASQSAGRAIVGLLAPPTRLAEFFGLWGQAVKLSSILGPMTYGLTNWLSGGDHRLAILITGSYFILGLLILASVDLKRGRRAALAELAAPQPG
ncbi:MFS transporter [Pseudomonas benzenivorans]|uniref:MFS transporter n=1 Tax=Pseudomonas benzenivorans TaxID=556533 RepID=A0ABY5HE93_9PSED|nr:MFS transporter [Pseudomonas benzenivorans]UTW09662.1 MFS transporter [Pseudomonas benzenivorans]